MKKYFLATIVTSLYIPLVTIVGELNAPFKNFFKNLFWHHWLGKGVVLIILYVICILIFSKTKETIKEERWLVWTAGMSIAGALSIFVFFVVEYLKHS